MFEALWLKEILHNPAAGAGGPCPVVLRSAQLVRAHAWGMLARHHASQLAVLS